MAEQNKVDGAKDTPVTDLKARQADVEASKQNRVAEDQSFVSTQRTLSNSPFATADGGDLNVGWTVQHGGAMPVNSLENMPGQVFSVDQLPDPEVARGAGIPPQQISPEYVLEGEEAFSHPSGPNAGEFLQAAQRKAVSEQLSDDQKAVYESDQFASQNRVGSDADASKKDEKVRVEAAKQSSLDGGNNSGTAGENGQPGKGRSDSTATGDLPAK